MSRPWSTIALASGLALFFVLSGCGKLSAKRPAAGSAAASEPAATAAAPNRYAEAATSPHVSPIVAVACSADGGRVLSAGANGSVWLWDSGGALVHRFDRVRPASALAFLHDGSRALFVGPAVALVDLKKRSQVSTFATERERGVTPGLAEVLAARCVALTPDGRLLAAGRADNRVEVWEVESGALVAELSGDEPQFDGREEGFVAVGISSDGASAAAIDARCQTWLWDVASGQVRSKGRVEVLAASSYTQAAAFSADCSRLLVSVEQRSSGTVEIVEVGPSGGESGPIDGVYALAVWDVAANRALHVLQSPGRDRVRGLALSADGRRAAAGVGSGDARVVVWDVDSGQQMAGFSGHRGQVLAAAISADGRWLVTGGQDYSARRWRLPE